MNLANKLTLIRIALVAPFLACFYVPWTFRMWLAAGIFVLAAVTDIFDGRYARKHNLVTNFGKLMDPIADKLLICSACIMLTAFDKLCPFATILFIAREFAVSGLRLVAASEGIVLAASRIGKAKTTLQCIAVVCLLLDNPVFSLIHVPFHYIATGAALAVSVWSGIDYFIKNREVFKTA